MPTDTRRPSRLQVYAQLLRYAAPYRRDWAVIVAVTLMSTALSLLQPWPLKVLVDHVLGHVPVQGVLHGVLARVPWVNTPDGLLAWAVLAGLGIYLVNTAAEFALSLQWTRVGRRMVYQLAGDLFARIQRRSLRAHTLHPVGDSMGRIVVDAWSVHAIVETLLFAPGHALLTTVLMVAVMARLDPGLTLLALGVAPLMTAAAWLFGRPIRAAAHARRDIESRLQAHVHQTLSGVSVVQAFTGEDDAQRRFQDLASQAIRTHQRTAFVGSAYGLGSGLLTTAGTALVMWAAAMRVVDGRLTTGTALVFLAYLATLQWQLSAFAAMYTTLQSAGASVDRVMDVLRSDEAVPERPGAPALPRVRGEVRIEHAVFAYAPGQPVLRGVNLVARAGESVAIVGATGAGKSTLVGLLPRFFDPTGGRVLIDGHDVRDVSLASVRDQVSVVLQEPFLFATSVAANISLGHPQATPDEIERAARAANAHDFISRLPQGYDTIIGERGATLSGGERQRIAIARAVLKNAPILILDEPTSALDVETEQAIVQALQRLMRGRTTFIVAHRLSTIRAASTIVVLENGRVVEQGSHTTLLTRGGRYARMHALQSPAFEEAVA
jgi:ATP-binding cassette subfamily B protein/subfamily B ATP-binding cassette protein MsbA